MAELGYHAPREGLLWVRSAPSRMAPLRHERSCAEILRLTYASPDALILLASVFDARILNLVIKLRASSGLKVTIRLSQ
jgi:hypothetical protein